MFLTLLGFLLAVMVLAAVVFRADPDCRERMMRLVRVPAAVQANGQMRRFIPSALPWWFYAIMAPPGLPELVQILRCRRFRR